MRRQGQWGKTCHGGMRRTMMAILLALACVLSPLVAGRAYAAGPSEDDVQLQAQANSYKLWVGGVQVTSSNKGDVLGDGHVSYNPSKNTLTLKNANIKDSRRWYRSEGTYRNDGIVALSNKTLTIKLAGTSKITVPYKSAMRCFAIDILNSDGSDQGNVVFTGSGKLTASAARAEGFSSGILADKITIKGSAKLVFKGAYATNLSDQYKRGGYGVAAKSKLLIQDKAQLTASGSTTAFYGYGFATPSFGSGYTPKVKAGKSASSISLTKNKPAKSVYASYKYIAITKASSSGTKTSSATPAKVTLKKPTAIVGGFKMSWKALSKNCTGYEVQVSKSSSFPSSGTWTFKSTSRTFNSATLTDLAGGTRYYVRIRGLNTKGKKTYKGAWSSVKSVVTLRGTAAG